MSYLSQQTHSNVLRLFNVYEDDTFLFLELECLSGGDLFEAVQTSPGGRFSEDRARKVMRQLLQGLCFMHGRGIIHRDLSLGERRGAAGRFRRVDLARPCPAAARHRRARPPPPGPRLPTPAENSMLSAPGDGGEAKIIDLGLCVDRWEHPPGDLPPLGCVGKAAYMAPEVFLNAEFGEASDVWCLGVMLFMMLFGVPPYRKPHADLCALFREIEAGRLIDLVRRWGMGGAASDEAQDMIRRMLTVDAAARPTLPEILAHPWMAPEMEALGGSATAARQANYILEVGSRVNAILEDARAKRKAEAAARAAAAAGPAAGRGFGGGGFGDGGFGGGGSGGGFGGGGAFAAGAGTGGGAAWASSSSSSSAVG